MYAVQTMYTIKQAAARTGLTVPVLRAWERRYGVVRPARTASGYRLYDEEAIARVLAMRRLVDSGWSPSAAAQAITSGTAPEPIASAGPAGTGEGAEGAAGANLAWTEPFLEAAGRLDSDALERQLDEMFARGSFERVADELLLPAVVALGDAWAAGRIDVAAEHLASHAVLRRLAAAYQAAGRPVVDSGAILVGLPPGSRHELGAFAFAVAARRAGLPVLYLGPDLPVDDWVASAGRMDARAAVIGSVTPADQGPARSVAVALWAARPELLIAFGGAHPPPVTPDDEASTSALVLPSGVTEAIQTLRRAVGAERRSS